MTHGNNGFLFNFFTIICDHVWKNQPNRANYKNRVIGTIRFPYPWRVQQFLKRLDRAFRR